MIDELTLNDIHTTVDGLMHDDELLPLAYHAGMIQNGCIVEIGAYRGLSTLCLAMSSAPQIVIYSIDPHISPSDDPFTIDSHRYGDEDRRIFTENMVRFGMAGRVRAINLSSVQASLGWMMPIGMLFVDGNHSFEAVLTDLGVWLPHVIKHGIIALHDSDRPEIKAAIASYRILEKVDEVHTLSVYRRL